MEPNLIAITCPADALGRTASTAEVQSKIQSFLGLDSSVDWEEHMKPLVYRVIVAPYPLTLSIASVLFPFALEIYLDPSLSVPHPPQETDTDQWLHPFLQKKKTHLTGYADEIPPFAYAYIILPEEHFPWFIQNEPKTYHTPLKWAYMVAEQVDVQQSAVPIPSSNSSISRYISEDDLLSRTLHITLPSLTSLFTNLTPPIDYNTVNTTVQTLTSQLIQQKQGEKEKEKLGNEEENGEMERKVRSCVDLSHKIREEVEKLKKSRV